MILPGSQLYNLIMLALGMLCLGTWANTFRMTSKWRFELYCFDFAIGTILAAILIGLTFGSLGWDGFALNDEIFRVAGKRQEAIGMGAGMVFSFGNMLILGALSIAGVTVAYMIGIGTMLTAGMVITYFTSPSGSGPMLAAGAGLFLVSAVLLAVTSRLNSIARYITLAREGKTKSTRKSVSVKGLVLAFLGGIVASICFPLMNAAREGENGLGPYSLGLFFAAGVGVSTAMCSLFFMNLPVQGDPIEVAAYFKGKARSHQLGILGGILFYLGLVSLLVVARAEGKSIVPLAAVAVGVLWGIVRWNEFEGASGKLKTMLVVALFLFVVGAAGLSAAAGISTAG